MTVAKVWDGSAWVTVAQGPVGPTGPQGPKGDTGAQGPAGPIGTVQDEGIALAGRSALNFTGAGVTATDDATNGRTNVAIPGAVAPAGAGRVVGAEAATTAAFTPADTLVQGKADGSQPIQLTVTAPYDCWWPIYAAILAKTVTAAWVRMNVVVRLSQADALGQTDFTTGIMHNSGASDYNHATPHGLYALAAGITYTVKLVCTNATGGQWSYYRGGGSTATLGVTYIHSPGVTAR